MPQDSILVDTFTTRAMGYCAMALGVPSLVSQLDLRAPSIPTALDLAAAVNAAKRTRSLYVSQTQKLI